MAENDAPAHITMASIRHQHAGNENGTVVDIVSRALSGHGSLAEMEFTKSLAAGNPGFVQAIATANGFRDLVCAFEEHFEWLAETRKDKGSL